MKVPVADVIRIIDDEDENFPEFPISEEEKKTFEQDKSEGDE
jgi:hypothetical protein